MNDSLTDLPNIGKTLEKKLKEAGIDSAQKLKKTGSENAFLRLDKPEDVNCINMLFALEGAVQGIRWHNLDAANKQKLREFYRVWKKHRKSRV